MNAHRCCQAQAGERSLRPSSPLRRIQRFVEWIVPSALLVLMPKCPLCVAAYLTAATGLGISLPMAAHLRLLMLTVCVIALAALATKCLRRQAR